MSEMRLGAIFELRLPFIEKWREGARFAGPSSGHRRLSGRHFPLPKLYMKSLGKHEPWLTILVSLWLGGAFLCLAIAPLWH